MIEKDRVLAEAVLRRLCQGAQIDGIRFGPIIQILITDHASSKPPIRGQVYLNVGSTWRLFDRVPVHLPESEADYSEMSDVEALSTLISIREQVITSVALGMEAPHLILTLESSRVLVLNGHHEQYEPWELGVALGDPAERWLVVACPGDAIAVWAPDSFSANEPAA